MSKVVPSVVHGFLGVAVLLWLPACGDDEQGASGTGGMGGDAAGMTSDKAGSSGGPSAGGNVTAGSAGVASSGGTPSGGGSEGGSPAAKLHCEKWFRKCGPDNEIGVTPIVVKNFTAEDGCLTYFDGSSQACRDCMVLHMMGLEGPGDTSHCYHTAGEGLEDACGCKF